MKKVQIKYHEASQKWKTVSNCTLEILTKGNDVHSKDESIFSADQMVGKAR